MTSPNPVRYTGSQKLLHWTMAAIIGTLAMVGLTMVHVLETGSLANAAYEAHKSAGLIVLGLAVVRIAVRLVQKAPGPVPGLASWQKAAAHGTHVALYGLVLIVPAAGWLATSTCCAPVTFLGLFPVELPPAGDLDAAKTVFRFHAWLAYAMIGLVALHVGAALHHHFVRRDDTFRRMWPW